jgi:hypothetical protein
MVIIEPDGTIVTTWLRAGQGGDGRTMRLTPMTRAILTGVLARCRPELLTLLDADNVDRENVMAVLNVLGDELATYGFDERSRPNAYGDLLERIIDEVNRIGFE